MIKYLKKLWKKFFGKTSKTLPENIGEEVVKHTPTDLPILIVTPKLLHCGTHARFKKSCSSCQEAIK